jgi:flagellar protein FlbD
MVELIILSRLGGPEFALNPDLIERAEATPDTVITLVGGNRYVVRQSIPELIALVRMARAEVISTAEALSVQPATSGRGRRSPAHDSAFNGRSVVPMRPRES